ncbi:MAG: hypothetical protein PSV16_09295 [Flavobacterium sp.]|nr:hypothetical protein [Flavobacterium sp.]
MAADRKKMIRSLNKYVLPKLHDINFTGTFPHFRRDMADRINFISFHFDTQGGGFVIDVANCNINGFMTASEQIIPLDKLTAHYFVDKFRIKAKMNGKNGRDDWFRYDRLCFFGLGDITKKVCREVILKLETAKEYWENGPVN